MEKTFRFAVIAVSLAVQTVSLDACDRCGRLALRQQAMGVNYSSYPGAVHYQLQYSYAVPSAYQPAQHFTISPYSGVPSYSPYFSYTYPLSSADSHLLPDPSQNLVNLGLGLGIPVAREAICRAAGCSNRSSDNNDQVAELTDLVKSLKKDIRNIKSSLEREGNVDVTPAVFHEVQISQLKRLLESSIDSPMPTNEPGNSTHH